MSYVDDDDDTGGSPVGASRLVIGRRSNLSSAGVRALYAQGYVDDTDNDSNSLANLLATSAELDVQYQQQQQQPQEWAKKSQISLTAAAEGPADAAGRPVGVASTLAAATDDTDDDGDSAAPNWNDEFQLLLERPTTTPEEVEEQRRQLELLADRFVAAATPVVQTLVDEQRLPTERRSVRPVRLPGIAGGSKYLRRKIFFKFAHDTTSGMYGGDEWASKAAGHELKSLGELLRLQLPKAHFPLVALITYRGFRVMCFTRLPISTKTLVYGSCDGGRTVHNDHDSMRRLMRTLGQRLCLKEHTVRGVPIVGPADMEGHVSPSDGRFYIADVSRLFPPALVPGPAAPKVKGSIWYRLLRPELVRAYGVPLSSDAFSAMGSEQRQAHDPDAADACRYLEAVAVPQCAERLQALWTSLGCLSLEQKAEFDVKHQIHQAGVNVRYLFQLLLLVTDPELKQQLLIEMVARCSRKLLWSRLRSLPLSPPPPPSADKGSAASAARRPLSLSSPSVSASLPSLSAAAAADDTVEDEEERAVWCRWANELLGGGPQAVEFVGERLPEELEQRFILLRYCDEPTQLERNRAYLRRLLSFKGDDERRLLQLRLEALAGFRLQLLQQQATTVTGTAGLSTATDAAAAAAARPSAAAAAAAAKDDDDDGQQQDPADESGVSPQQEQEPQQQQQQEQPHEDDDESMCCCWWVDQVPLEPTRVRLTLQPICKLPVLSSYARGDTPQQAVQLAREDLRALKEVLGRHSAPVAERRMQLAELLQRLPEASFGGLAAIERQLLKAADTFERLASLSSLSSAPLPEDGSSHHDARQSPPSLTPPPAAAASRPRSSSASTPGSGSGDRTAVDDAHHQPQQQQQPPKRRTSRLVLSRALSLTQAAGAFRSSASAAAASSASSLSSAAALGAAGRGPQPSSSSAARRRRRTVVVNRLDVARAKERLAYYYLLYGEHAKAEATLNEVMAIKQSRLPPRHVSMARTLDALAQVHRRRGDYGVAERLFRQSLDILQQSSSLGADDPVLADTMCNLALLYRQQREFDQAEALYRRALQLLLRVYGPSASGPGRVSRNLAQVFLLQGKASEAQPLLEQALVQSRAALGNQHVETATACVQLADCYATQGRTADAEALLCEALDIRRSLLGDEHYAVGKALAKLAELKAKQAVSLDESRALFEQALKVLTATLGDSHPYVATIRQQQRSLLRLVAIWEEGETGNAATTSPAELQTSAADSGAPGEREQQQRQLQLQESLIDLRISPPGLLLKE